MTEYKLRLKKILSYDNGKVKASRRAPDVTVESKEDADYLVETGYFDLIRSYEVPETKEPKVLIDMNVTELKEYAAQQGIDVKGLTKKEDIRKVIEEAEAEKELDADPMAEFTGNVSE